MTCRLWFGIAALSGIGIAAPGSSHCPAPGAKPILTLPAFRSLSRDEANRCLPVHLTATVTYWTTDLGLYFVQDGDYGVFLLGDINPAVKKMNLRPGDRIEITGASSGGDFSSDLWPMQVRLISHGPLPEPIRATGEDLLRNRYDCIRLRTEGRVLATMVEPGRGTWLFVDIDGHQVQVIVQKWGGPKPDSLIDSRVQVTGIGAATFSPDGIYIGPQVFVYDQSGIALEGPVRPDPFDIPVTAISEVLRNPSGKGIQTLVHIRGAVTGNSHARFYMEQNGHGLLVRPTKRNSRRRAIWWTLWATRFSPVLEWSSNTDYSGLRA